MPKGIPMNARIPFLLVLLLSSMTAFSLEISHIRLMEKRSEYFQARKAFAHDSYTKRVTLLWDNGVAQRRMKYDRLEERKNPIYKVSISGKDAYATIKKKKNDNSKCYLVFNHPGSSKLFGMKKDCSFSESLDAKASLESFKTYNRVSNEELANFLLKFEQKSEKKFSNKFPYQYVPRTMEDFIEFVKKYQKLPYNNRMYFNYEFINRVVINKNVMKVVLRSNYSIDGFSSTGNNGMSFKVNDVYAFYDKGTRSFLVVPKKDIVGYYSPEERRYYYRSLDPVITKAKKPSDITELYPYDGKDYCFDHGKEMTCPHISKTKIYDRHMGNFFYLKEAIDYLQVKFVSEPSDLKKVKGFSIGKN